MDFDNYKINSKLFIRNNHLYNSNTSDSYENVPRSGFSLQSSTRFGLVIKTPEDFLFSIPPQEIVRCLSYLTIDNGIIKDECIIASHGKDFVLLSRGSDPYMKLMTIKEDEDNSIVYSKKDIHVGDTISLKPKKYDNKSFIYAGEFYSLFFIEESRVKSNVFSFGLTQKIGFTQKDVIEFDILLDSKFIKRHYFYSVDVNNNYTIVSFSLFPKIKSIIEECNEENISLKDKAQEIIKSHLSYCNRIKSLKESEQKNFISFKTTFDCNISVNAYSPFILYNYPPSLETAREELLDLFDPNFETKDF